MESEEKTLSAETIEREAKEERQEEVEVEENTIISSSSIPKVVDALPKKSEPLSSETTKTSAIHPTQIVTADSVEAEEVPTVPMDSIKTISTLRPEVSVHSVASTKTLTTPEPLVQTSEYRRNLFERLQIWGDGLRLGYLPIAVMPVILGTVLAWTSTISETRILGSFQWLPFVGILAVTILIQLGANLINDYYDYLRGIDTSNTFGPGGLIQQGHVRPTRVLRVGLIFLALGTILGLFVAFSAGPLGYVLGLVGVACAYFYSSSRFSLSSFVLGELAGFFIFGPMLTVGAYMAQTNGNYTTSILLYSLIPGLIALAAIHANNVRDIEGDMHAKKRTIATFLGVTVSRFLYILLLLGAYAVVVYLGFPSKTPHWILMAFWTLPSTAVAISGMLRTNAPAGFHLVMHQTLRIEVFFIIFVALGLIIHTAIPVLPSIPLQILGS